MNFSIILKCIANLAPNKKRGNVKTDKNIENRAFHQIPVLPAFLETHLLHTNTVLSPCRGTPEWRMYGASTVRIHFRYGQGMNSVQKQILHASVHTSI